MKFLLFILSFVINISVYSQILATDNYGKKVILNNDGTWYYANLFEINNLKNLDCLNKNTGNVKFTNNTDRNIYIYFGNTEKKFMLEPNSFYILTDIWDKKSYGFNEEKEPYSYKILYDWSPDYLQYKHIKNYVENGNVYIIKCETIEIIIDNL